MKFPDRHSVFHRITELDPKAGIFKLEGVCLSEKHQRIAAQIEEEVVVYDYAKGKRIEMPGWMEEVMRRQEEEERGEGMDVREEKGEIDAEVERLEKEVLGRAEM